MCIHAFNKDLWNSYCALDTVLGAEGETVLKAEGPDFPLQVPRRKKHSTPSSFSPYRYPSRKAYLEFNSMFQMAGLSGLDVFLFRGIIYFWSPLMTQTLNCNLIGTDLFRRSLPREARH